MKTGFAYRFKNSTALHINVAVILTLLYMQISFAQSFNTSAEYFSVTNYAEAPMQPGLPETEPVKIYNLKIKDASYAWINPVGNFEEICFIKGIDTDKKMSYLVLTFSSLYGVSLFPFTVTDKSEKNVYGYALISETLDNTYSFPLRINYSINENLIRYTWPESVNQISQGTIIPIIMKGDKLNRDVLSLLKSNIKPGGLSGKTIVLQYGDTASHACKKSVADFKSLAADYASGGNMMFVSVGINNGKTKIGKNTINFPFNNVLQKYFGDVMPLNLVIDPAGNVVFSSVGYGMVLKKQIADVLNNYKGNR